MEKLRRGIDRPFSINDLDATYLGLLRRMAFDSWVPLNAAELLTVEMEEFLPDVYRRLAADAQGVTFIKVHDAAKRNIRGEWIYPTDCMPNVLYLVRHPYDVAVSSAHHLGVTLERAVEIMADDGSARPPHAKLLQSLEQTFGSWSGNVESWLDNDSYNVTWARYEDVCEEPVSNFLRFAQAAGLHVSRDAVAVVVRETRFQDLQREEAKHGFKERPHSSLRFFRAGGTETWRGILDEKLMDRLARHHGRVMERLGYNEDGTVGSIQAAP
jgi:hypothetical protein